MRTAEVKSLVENVLESIPQPYSHHVIEDVFLAIEENPQWRKQYNSLCSSLGRDVVNKWSGKWVALALGKTGEQQVSSKKSSLIGSYSVLDTDAKTLSKKPTDAEARKMMSDYYRIHQEELPTDVHKYRERILEFLASGLLPEQAFEVSLDEEGWSRGKTDA